VSTDGASVGSLELRGTEEEPSDQPRRHDDVTSSTAVHQSSSSAPPPPRDVIAGSDVSKDWAEQLVDIATMLSRLAGLEYFSDGAALTKCLWFW